MLFTDRFFPKGFEEFIGNVEIVEKTCNWAKAWEKGKKQKPLLFHGPPGVGKTCLALLTAKVFDWSVFELNASNLRNKENVERLAGAAMQTSSFSGKPRLVLLDEVDGLQSSDRGGAAAISKILKVSQNPVILTANDIYAKQSLAVFRGSCDLQQFKKINYLSIAKRLREICEIEHIDFEEDAVKELARACSGDFRSALLDLQTLSFTGKISGDSLKSLGFRARQENIFKVVEKIFKANTVSEAREARFKSDISGEMLMNWIEENIPRHFKEKKDIGNAFEQLSRADIFEGRIMRRQHYGFKRYSSELMTSGVALSRSRDYGGWIQYQFPGLLRKLSSNKGERNLKKALAKKIGSQLHSSTRAFISNDLFYFKMVFPKNPEKYAAQFDLNENEIAFLLGSKPTTKKVQKIFEGSREIRKKEFANKRRLQPLEAEIQDKGDSAQEEHKPVTEDSPNQTRLF